MINDPVGTKIMGSGARKYVEVRSIKAAFLKTWDMYCEDTISASNPELQAKAS